MTQKTLNRKPRAQHGRVRTAPRSPKARPGKKRRLTRGSVLLVLALTYGTAVAMLLVAVGFTAVVRDGGTSHGSHQSHSASGGAGHGSHAQNNNGPQPNIQIQARHVGNLMLDIKVEVSMNKKRDPLMKAKAAAYLDMVEMPGAHRKGPLPLQAVTEQPGLYKTTAKVPMPGTYTLRVVVNEPVTGERTTTVEVGTTGTK